MKTVLVDDVIDARPFGAFQLLVFAVCFVIALMDGANIQTMGLSAPLLAADLKLLPTQLGPVFAGSEFGFMIGALAFGPLADRFGRKSILVLCTLLFGFASLATVQASSFHSLLLLRVVTGLGLGGAAPCFVSLTTEYVSQRLRARVASLLWAAIPAGGVVAGFAGSALIPAYGWKSMFYLSGIVPIAAALVVVLLVPESVRFLILTGASEKRVSRILSRLGVTVGSGTSDAVHYVTHEHETRGLPMLHLFREGRASFTALLWIAFFLNFLALIAVLAWTSTLLKSAGMSVADASIVMAWNNVGGMIGVAAAGKLMERLGTHRFPALIFVCGAVMVGCTGVAAPHTALVSLFSGLTGLFVGGATAGLIAIAAMGYPTAIRSTGVGYGLAAGRLGGATGPVIVGTLVASGMGVAQTYLFVSVPVVLAALVMLLMRRAHPDDAQFVTGVIAH
ncbi:MFS transporter [Paraburkholderia elongata]|nr:MFS transporter [Paraburkholderia elongata]